HQAERRNHDGDGGGGDVQHDNAGDDRAGPGGDQQFGRRPRHARQRRRQPAQPDAHGLGPVNIAMADGSTVVGTGLDYDAKTSIWTFGHSTVTLPQTPGSDDSKDTAP